MSVWHAAIAPASGQVFDEDVLIKLSKLVDVEGEHGRGTSRCSYADRVLLAHRENSDKTPTADAGFVPVADFLFGAKDGIVPFISKPARAVPLSTALVAATIAIGLVPGVLSARDAARVCSNWLGANIRLTYCSCTPRCMAWLPPALDMVQPALGTWPLSWTAARSLEVVS